MVYVVIVIIIIVHCFDFEDDEPRDLLKAGVLLQAVAHLLGSYAGWEIPSRVARDGTNGAIIPDARAGAASMPIARRMMASAVFWLFVAIGYESSK